MPIFSLASYRFETLSVSVLVVSVIILALGAWVLALSTSNREHRQYALLTILLAPMLATIGLSAASLTQDLSSLWDRISWGLLILVTPALYTFEATHLGIPKLRRWIAPFYAVAAFFLIALPSNFFLDAGDILRYSWGSLQKLGPIGYAYAAYHFGMLVALLIIHGRRMREPGLSERNRKVYRITFTALLLALAASLDLLGYMGIAWPPFSFIFMTVWMGLFAYGVVRHRLFLLTMEIAAPTIIESMPSALFVVNMDGEIIITNPYASKLTRVSAEEMRGRRVTEFIQKAAGLLVEAGEHPPLGPLRSAAEASLKDAEGKEYPVALSAMAVMDKRGAPNGVTIIATDIGKMREHVDTIAAQKAELEKTVGEMRKIQEQLVGRELKMIELKKEIEELKKK